MKPSYTPKIGMISSAARSLPRRELAGAQRVQGQRGGIQGAVEAEHHERQDQPGDREQAEDHRGQVGRRDAAAQDGQQVEQHLLAVGLGADQDDERLLQGLAAPDLSGGAGGHDPALVDDADVVADLLDQLHHVAGEQHRGAGAGEAGQQPADDVGGDRIDAFERLVQEQHGGVVDQRAAQHGLLAHAGGVVRDQPFGVLGQVEHGEQRPGPGASLIGRHAAKPPGVLQTSPARDPGAITRSIPATACFGPKLLRSPVTAIAGSFMSASGRRAGRASRPGLGRGRS
jgi:hypothetical protein